MANYEATRYDFDGQFLTDVEGVNTGIIIPWSNASIPSGFLDCDGTAVSRTTYAALFAVVGTNYGAGDGSTTFNVPDLTDRTCVGTSPTKAQFSTGGANTVTTTGNLAGSSGNTTLSTAQLPSHNHSTGGQRGSNGGTVQSGQNSNGSAGGNSTGASGNAGSDGSHSHSFAGNFTGGADSVLQPYLTLNYIIKT